MNEGLIRKYQRVNDLLGVGNVTALHIQTEIADIKRDLMLNGETDEDIDAHTNARRFDPDFIPTGEQKEITTWQN